MGNTQSWDDVRRKARARRASVGLPTASPGPSSRGPSAASVTKRASSIIDSIKKGTPDLLPGVVKRKYGDYAVDVYLHSHRKTLKLVPFSSLSFAKSVAVDDTVMVGFVEKDFSKPFIVGPGTMTAPPPPGDLENGMTRGLAWHNGADGTPDYTGSLYSLDTGYRKWKHDAGWSIPGPWDAIIGYTVDQGYILTVRGKDVRCYYAGSGTLAWSYELPVGVASPIYNPARKEVVFTNWYDNDFFFVDAILDAATGQALVGRHSLGQNGLGSPYVFGNKLFWAKPSMWFETEASQRPSCVWTRGAAGYSSKREIRLEQADISWGNGDWPSSSAHGPKLSIYPMFVADKRLYYRSGYANCDAVANEYSRYQAWESLGVLDLETESSVITDNTFGTPGPIGWDNSGGYIGWDHRLFIECVPARDGNLHGTLIGRWASNVAYRTIQWSPVGRRKFEGPIVQGVDNASSPDAAYPPIYLLCNRSLVVASVLKSTVPAVFGLCVLKDGLPLWSLPSGDSLTGHGGESLKGEDPWVLVSSPGGWHFRDFRTGAVLGTWAGSTPVMVSAGIIYDTDDDGNLRRWVG